MQVRRRDMMVMEHAPAAVLEVLLDGGHLAEWNPAFTSATGDTDAQTGSHVGVTVRGIPGSLRYTHVGSDRVGMLIRIPGLTETSTWWLETVPRGTRVTHELLQSGPLSRVLEPATRDVATLRLDRLRRRLDSPARRIT